MRKMKIISNSDICHLDELKELFLLESQRIIITSPFLAPQIDNLLNEFNFSNTNKIELITTFKANDPEQITKPKIIKEFFEFFQKNYSKIVVKVHINNKLHGKIYISENEDVSYLILGSANFTRKGLCKNNEWGVAINDQVLIKQTIDQIYSTVEYPDVTYHQIKKACMLAEYTEKNNPDLKTKPKLVSDILNTIYTVENTRNIDPQYFLKPIGHSDDPILLEEQRDFSDLHQNLHFSKKKPKGLTKGDIIITTAVGAGSLLSYFKVTGGLQEATDQEIKNDPWKERWPWYMEGRNQSTEFGSKWWVHNIRRQDALNEFLKKYPKAPVTYAGGFTLGTINMGSDKVRISKEFGDFLISKIDNAK